MSEDIAFWLPAHTKLFEAVAAVQIMQALSIGGIADNPAIDDLLALAQVRPKNGSEIKTTLPFGQAFVAVNKNGVETSYMSVLAEKAGYAGLLLKEPCLSFRPRPPDVRKNIVLCPFALAAGVGIDDRSVWAQVHFFLRTYDQPVLLLSEPGEWLDNCTFAENEILSEMPLSFKLEVLASAALVVGVPNAWMWMAAALQVPMALLYPEWIPAKRWFPFSSEIIVRAILEHPVRIPSLLAGLRHLISIL